MIDGDYRLFYVVFVALAAVFVAAAAPVLVAIAWTPDGARTCCKG